GQSAARPPNPPRTPSKDCCVKFLFAETSDTVDPGYDFSRLRQGRTRRVQSGDEYPHEHLGAAPYDGILLSRAAFTDHHSSGKYSAAKTMRFRREGARRFLRYPEARHPGSMVMGDCGAFSYRDAYEPLYSVENTLEFYADGGFTHGCSVDHLIFDFDLSNGPGTAEARRRQELTLSLAGEFKRLAPALGTGFTPVGVIQGWSPQSMASAAAALVKMGFDYLAIGGMARSETSDILAALELINTVIGVKRVGLHVLGFGKIEDAPRLRDAGATSFDTTSPLLRAFKDDKRNYFVTDGGTLNHFTAIRIPQASDDKHARRSAAARTLGQEALLEAEASAMQALRDYAARQADLESSLAAVMHYAEIVFADDARSPEQNRHRFSQLEQAYTRTLAARPWEACHCRVCREIGVE